jgi:hypothetical protein
MSNPGISKEEWLRRNQEVLKRRLEKDPNLCIHCYGFGYVFDGNSLEKFLDGMDIDPHIECKYCCGMGRQVKI